MIARASLPSIETTKELLTATTEHYSIHSRLVIGVSIEDRLSILVANRLKVLVLYILMQRQCSRGRPIYLHTIIIGHDHQRSHVQVNSCRARNRVWQVVEMVDLHKTSLNLILKIVLPLSQVNTVHLP
jgi:hypothetical protein